MKAKRNNKTPGMLLVLVIALAIVSSLTLPVAATATESSAQTAGMHNFVKARTYAPRQFPDVDDNAWYGLNQQKVIPNAYEYDLMQGNENGTFAPAGNVTLAQALAVAARVHSIYNTGTQDFRQGAVWYQVYVDYAIANGIIAANTFSNYTRNATRAEMAHIFYMSLPYTEFPAKNEVIALPDVTDGTMYQAAIFMLYEAGVLAGDAGTGAFRPGGNITRAEASAIISRVILEDERFRGRTFGGNDGGAGAQVEGWTDLGIITIPSAWIHEVQMHGDLTITGGTDNEPIIMWAGELMYDSVEAAVADGISSDRFVFNDGHTGYIVYYNTSIWWIREDWMALSLNHGGDLSVFDNNKELILRIARSLTVE